MKNYKNYALSSVAIAPSPATSGTTMTLATGEGAYMPAVPFSMTVCAVGARPVPTNAEIVLVTALSGDAITAMTRAQGGTTARAIVVGDECWNTDTAEDMAAWTLGVDPTTSPTYAGLTLTSPLTVPNGGTGVASLAANGVLYGNGTGVALVTAQGPANSVLTANAGAPSFSASPTLTGLTLTGLTNTRAVFATTGGLLTGSLMLSVGSNYLQSYSTTAFSPIYFFTSVGDSGPGAMYFQKARAGTTDVQNGDSLGAFGFQGYANAAYNNSANIAAACSAAPVGSLVKSYLRFTVTNATALDTVRLVVYPSGVGVGSNFAPTAMLHIQAGTATANTAPLKFNSGTLLTTAEAGAVEFLTDKFYGTITTGAARKELTLNDAALTSGRVPFATTNGRLTDDSDLTFATDTLTATKMVGTTSVKVGTAAGFISSDGSTGATGTFTTTDGKTVTVKDGLVTAIV